MGEAYTPGLEVNEATVVRKRRVLPIPGKVVVEKGDKVEPETVVAIANIPGPFKTVDVRADLGISVEDVKEALNKWFKVKVGDHVNKGDLLAKRKYFFGRRVKESRAPIDGTIEYISDITGKVHIREPSVPIEVKAYIPGEVVEVLPKEGVIIETLAAFVQGIFGVGGETHGELVVVASPDEVITEDKIKSEHAGKILVGGSLITGEALQKASRELVNGIIVGGVDYDSLINYLGYEIGVAVTGEEDVNTTLIITEGFGKMRMLKWTFDLLKKLEGKEASISGATHIRAGVIRPEVIIPLKPEEFPSARSKSEIDSRLKPGTTVRIIRGPHFGAFAKVLKLVETPKEIETESKTSVIEVLLENGRRLVVPRANVEIIGGRGY